MQISHPDPNLKTHSCFHSAAPFSLHSIDASEMEIQSTVKDYINTLYHHPNNTVRMQTDCWLQDFQRTLDALQVADNLLHDTAGNLETLIFCSQTLRRYRLMQHGAALVAADTDPQSLTTTLINLFPFPFVDRLFPKASRIFHTIITYSQLQMGAVNLELEEVFQES